jgi:hypothetical protein
MLVPQPGSKNNKSLHSLAKKYPFSLFSKEIANIHRPGTYSETGVFLANEKSAE